tara:strand:- start:65 stop:823 length:759 start_codon:yes stop_codon:yes gene_type:complete
MLNFFKISFLVLITTFILFPNLTLAQPITHEVSYPDGSGPFPAVITLHTSGGFKPTKKWIENFKSKVWTDAGYVVYAPNFYEKHGLTPRTRMETFSTYREDIEKELSVIVELAKNNPKVDNKNIFAVGFSNGGFWACFLAGTAKINAGASHYGVWKANMGREITNPYPMNYFSQKSSPLLALHGEEDSTQKMKFVEEAWDEVKSSGGKLTTHVYPSADHAWDSKSKRFNAWDPKVKEDAFQRTLSFFKKHAR